MCRISPVPNHWLIGLFLPQPAMDAVSPFE
jgi:hypothetical protein